MTKPKPIFKSAALDDVHIEFEEKCSRCGTVTEGAFPNVTELLECGTPVCSNCGSDLDAKICKIKV